MKKNIILANSFPKAGTNLLSSILDLFPLLRFHKLILNRRLHWHPLNFVQPWSETCYSGITQPRKVKLGTIHFQLLRLKNNQYTKSHLPYDTSLVDLIHNLGIKIVFIIRDPRDIMVSQMNYVRNNPDHYLFRFLKDKADKDFLAALYSGIKENNKQYLLSMKRRLKIVEGWMHDDRVFLVKFENLVGGKGGGGNEIQQKTINNLANYLGIKISLSEAASIGIQAFGRGATFHKGSIGSYKNIMNHNLLCKINEELEDFLSLLNYELYYGK